MKWIDEELKKLLLTTRFQWSLTMPLLYTFVNRAVRWKIIWKMTGTESKLLLKNCSKSAPIMGMLSQGNWSQHSAFKIYLPLTPLHISNFRQTYTTVSFFWTRQTFSNQLNPYKVEPNPHLRNYKSIFLYQLLFVIKKLARLLCEFSKSIIIGNCRVVAE